MKAMRRRGPLNNAALAQAFECRIHSSSGGPAKSYVSIHFGPRDSVETGAVVRIDGRWFVIAVAKRCLPVRRQGTYTGNSHRGPIDAAIADAQW